MMIILLIIIVIATSEPYQPNEHCCNSDDSSCCFPKCCNGYDMTCCYWNTYTLRLGQIGDDIPASYQWTKVITLDLLSMIHDIRLDISMIYGMISLIVFVSGIFNIISTVIFICICCGKCSPHEGDRVYRHIQMDETKK
jgi:hypothetical protein